MQDQIYLRRLVKHKTNLEEYFLELTGIDNMRRLLEIEYFKIRYHSASLRLLTSCFILIPMLIFLY